MRYLCVDMRKGEQPEEIKLIVSSLMERLQLKIQRSLMCEQTHCGSADMPNDYSLFHMLYSLHILTVFYTNPLFLLNLVVM